MLYTENLEEIIFHRHEMFASDELIILSGYVGPKPIERLQFLPFQSKVIYGMYGSEGIKSALHYSLIDIIWDDDVSMAGLFFGNQTIDGIMYPKQVSSFPHASEMGKYLRKRLHVPDGQPVRKHHLDRYGRSTIGISLLSEGVYRFDFSL